MANIKSQIKRNRTNEEARERNKAAKSAIRTSMKKVRVAVEAKDLAKAEAAFKMRRYSTVLDILLPISSKTSLETLSEYQRDKVKKLLEESANKKFQPGK